MTETAISSDELVRTVIQNSSLNSNSFLISILLASRYSEHDGYSIFTLDELSAESGLARQTVLNALKEIEASCEWKAISKRPNPTYYIPSLTKLRKKQPKRAKSSSNRGNRNHDANGKFIAHS